MHRRLSLLLLGVACLLWTLLLSPPGQAQQLSCLAGSPAPIPPNDNYASATSITTVPFAALGDNRCATIETGETDPCPWTCNIQESVWFEWTPTYGGVALAESCGSGFDTVLGVYAGASVAAPAIAYNDNDNTGACTSFTRSHLRWMCNPGTTYHIQLSAEGFGAGGSTAFGLSGCDGLPPPPCPGPANNCFDDAVLLAPGASTSTQGTLGSDMEYQEPMPCAQMGATVWYQWTPSTSGLVTIDTFGSTFNTVLATFTGTSLGGLALQDCDNDTSSLQSQVTIPCVAGTTYMIQAGGYNGDQGNLQLNVGACRPPPPPACGYTVTDPAPYDFVDLTGIGTGLPHCDDTSLVVPLPFTFTCCGVPFTYVETSSNGYLCPGGSSLCAEAGPNTIPIPANPSAAIYAYFSDLDPTNCSSATPASCTSWAVLGNAPSRIFVYMEEDLPFCCSGAAAVSLEIKLFESTNCLEVHYRSVSDPANHRVVAGYQDAGGTVGFTYADTKPGFMRAGQAWRACPGLQAVPDTFLLNEDHPVQVALPVMGNDFYASGGASVVAVGPASLGTTTASGPSILYLPTANRNGIDVFSYTIQDVTGFTSTSSVTVTLQPVNDRPSFAADAMSILAPAQGGTVVIPGWASMVMPGPASAVDEAAQGVVFEVDSNSNPGLFSTPPVVARTANATALSPSPLHTGSFGLLRFTPSGRAGMATVCFRARDDGGAAAVSDGWGVVARGADQSDPPRCVHITANAAPFAYFEPTAAIAAPRQPMAFDPCPRPAPDCSHDPDGAIVSYLWEFGDGSSIGLATPSHAYGNPGEYQARLTVCDEHGSCSTYQRLIAITWPGGPPPAEMRSGGAALPPVADAGENQTVLEAQAVQLRGVGRGAGQYATFHWTQVSGPTVALSDPWAAEPTFTAPGLATAAPVELIFALRVEESGGGTADYVRVQVITRNRSPVAHADGPRQVVAGNAVQLDASRTVDPDGDALRYTWEQVPAHGQPLLALSDPHAVRPTFVAPPGTAHLRFQLRVSDGKATSQDTVTIVSGPSPQPEPDPPRQAHGVQPVPQRQSTAHALGWAPALAVIAAFLGVAWLVVAIVFRKVS